MNARTIHRHPFVALEARLWAADLPVLHELAEDFLRGRGRRSPHTPPKHRPSPMGAKPRVLAVPRPVDEQPRRQFQVAELPARRPSTQYVVHGGRVIG